MEITESLEGKLEKIGDNRFNAFIQLDPEGARKRAEEIDRGMKDKKAGKLAGMTIAIKSNICVDGLRATCASKTLDNYVAPYDAHVIGRIKAEGGIIVGMANMDEFACGASGETSYYGPTDNPSAPGRVPGGSSSGSAAAVAAGFTDLGLGSDTGGSIRNPSSHCGVVGFKPTYGLVSRYGLIDMAMSLDQIGPIARTVKDAALLLDVIAGYDHRDATSLNLEKTDFSKNLDTNLKGKKIGYAKEFDELITDEGIRNVTQNAIDKLGSAGAEVREVTLPSLDKAIATYYLNVYVEFFSATRKYDGRRYGHKIENVCGEEVLRRILLGSYISQKEYQGRFYRRGLQARSVIRNELMRALRDVDVLVSPAVPKLPHKIGVRIEDPMVMYAYDAFTIPANLAGVPAGVVPAGKTDGIPKGLQVIGKPLEDQKVLDVMAGFEKIDS
ncbi:MAG: Asp-tRNA(Asn)/Glu-tRNA(Gln) amidotransferase subunit GatA [Candidatus Altiarchaeota archaeon]|nr:Asp-tRNA(Asn)/Glu-tRNA(Gln) amidotransferase subunit GatA [Candidatus Altiarchaeota archaeon]